ncbi:MAG: helix-turn-helix domain-containing protein [Prevotella sp.]|jgi:predicted DNA-binding transcriptional regulator AlpA|uniref:helix-turn-helix domain-containing protein n=1 Tax=Segatella hominis TaxID=2518605 RepID=UPI0026364152
MNITEISSNSQIQLVLNKADLKELFLEWKEESELNRKKETETLLTPDEVASKYRISKVTLWRWAKDGLLKPVKMGRKSFYRQSDIERVFDLNK